MRPLTQSVFKRLGEAIVGSRWTSKQVCQAYEKADDLLNYIAEYKAFKPVREMGIDKIHFGFADGLEVQTEKNLQDEAVQSLSLKILWDLLEKGRHVLHSAAWIYKYTPETFKSTYASSKQAFLKDRFFFQKVPTFSFPSFRTGDNPAIIQDEKISQTCANLYNSMSEPYSGDNIPLNYALWLNSTAGKKFSRETAWLQETSTLIHQKRLGTDRSTQALISEKQKTL